MRVRQRGSLGVPVVLVLAGFLFTISAQTANGTQLRSERADLAGLLQSERDELARTQERYRRLQVRSEEYVAAAAADNDVVRQLRARSELLVDAVGLRAIRGRGLVVTLDDAPRDEPVPAEARPDDLVVHQQDVQAVVNALWAGGAEAMMLQDQRVVSTSAVRCVGNTLILQGRVYSPPYTVTAIGDVASMRRALDAAPEVQLYLQFVDSLNLGWSVEPRQVTLPAFDGPLTLRHARAAGGAPATGGTPSGTPPAP